MQLSLVWGSLRFTPITKVNKNVERKIRGFGITDQRAKKHGNKEKALEHERWPIPTGYLMPNSVMVID